MKKKLKDSEISIKLKEIINLWKNYYYLSYMFPDNVIIYDEWINNIEYRIKISEKLFLNNVEEDIFTVHGHGKSMFNTSIKHVNPEELLKRYEIYKTHKVYKNIVCDDNELKIMWNSTVELHCNTLKNYVFNKMFPPTDFVE